MLVPTWGPKPAECLTRVAISVCRQGDIFRCWDGPNSTHRVLVVSRDELNRGDYVVTVQFTSTNVAKRKTEPNCVYFKQGTQTGLSDDCVMQGESIAVTDKVRLEVASGPLGRVEGEKFEQILAAIANVLGACFYRL